MVNLSKFTTLDPLKGMNKEDPGNVQNLVSGEWIESSQFRKDIPEPLTGEHFLNVPDTKDFSAFIKNLEACPKSGLHNPLKNVERYLMLGEVCARASELMRNKQVEEFFTRLIQRVMPKTKKQCLGAVSYTHLTLPTKRIV